MNDKITVGDVVWVTQWPCCNAAGGEVFTVTHIGSAFNAHCAKCKAEHAFGGFHYATSGNYALVPLQWLKKIPPLEQLEGERCASGLDERAPAKTPSSFGWWLP